MLVNLPGGRGDWDGRQGWRRTQGITGKRDHLAQVRGYFRNSVSLHINPTEMNPLRLTLSPKTYEQITLLSDSKHLHFSLCDVLIFTVSFLSKATICYS